MITETKKKRGLVSKREQAAIVANIDRLSNEHGSLSSSARKALLAGDLDAYLLLFGSHERWEPLIEIAFYVKPKCMPRLFHEMWTDAKNLPDEEDLRYMMDALVLPKTFNQKDKATFKRLPEVFTAYRGAGQRSKPSRSWTLSRDIAEWFANRNAWGRGRGKILHLQVSKVEVLFYTDGRSEQEIVLIEPRDGDVLELTSGRLLPDSAPWHKRAVKTEKSQPSLG